MSHIANTCAGIYYYSSTFPGTNFTEFANIKGLKLEVDSWHASFDVPASFPLLVQFVYQIIAAPMLHDFYNYDSEDRECYKLFIKFTQDICF
ncbi:hypothetical protein MANES_13G032300v8 [Manihot esculenta]|uniref:Uncharacterized protein n=1 Tax=Manihot esculenta TaxID=3983 RepID=A0A251JEW3_MANES|nr:hypothetical protein MANES_13G032300v8 [Manihot esculenta]